VLAAPEARVKKVSASALRVLWGRVAGADGYVVYRYSAKAKRYLSVETVKALGWTDKGLKRNTVYKYKVRAFAVADGKKVWSGESLWVSAMAYSADSRKGNAGRVRVRPMTMGLWTTSLISTWSTIESAADMEKSGADVGFGVWRDSTYWFRQVFDERVRFVQLSGRDVVRVSSAGRVRSFGKAGVARVRVVLHNGNSAVTTITVDDYARKGGFDTTEFTVSTVDVGAAGSVEVGPVANRAVVFMATQRRAELGEVAAWLVEHKIAGTFSLGDNLSLVSDVELGAEGEELLRSFFDSVPYKVEVLSEGGVNGTVQFFSTAISDYYGWEMDGMIEYQPMLWNAWDYEHRRTIANHWIYWASMPFT
jgi:PAS domain-containing protein